MVAFSQALDQLKANVYDNDMKQQHQDCVKTLFKILENLILKKDDPKVRSLPKANKSVQSKVLAYPQAIQFMEVAGFDFS